MLDIELIYSKYYKRIMLVPLLLFLVFAFISFVYPGILFGIDIKGGTMLLVHSNKKIDAQELKNLLSKYNLIELSIIPFSDGFQIKYKTSKFIEEASNEVSDAISKNDEKLCEKALEKLSNLGLIDRNYGRCLAIAQSKLSEAKSRLSDVIAHTIASHFSLNIENIQTTEISPALGALFWKFAFYAAIIAVFLIFVTVFIWFREFLPSIAIIAAATFDILAALSGIAILRIPFSLPVISAMLMLLGYSVDTDIMLTTRVLKSTRSASEVPKAAKDAFRTGLTMTSTSLIAVSIMFLLSSLWSIQLMYSISAVLFFGLLADIISTWMMNAPLLIWYANKKLSAKK